MGMAPLLLKEYTVWSFLSFIGVLAQSWLTEGNPFFLEDPNNDTSLKKEERGGSNPVKATTLERGAGELQY